MSGSSVIIPVWLIVRFQYAPTSRKHFHFLGITDMAFAQVEFDFLGRVLSQVEQACAHLPPTPRLRVNNVVIQNLSPVRHVPHVPPQRGRT